MKKSIIIILIAAFSLSLLFVPFVFAKDDKITITSFVQVDGWPLWYGCIEKIGYTAEDIVVLQAKKTKGEAVQPFRGKLNLLKNDEVAATLKTGSFSLPDLQKRIIIFNNASKKLMCPAEVELRTVSSSSGAYLPAFYIKEVPVKF